MKTIPIIRGLGGNGSTFLSRAITAMDGIVLLSETNPCSANILSFALNPAYQIKHHYPAADLPDHDGHMVELGAPPIFGRYIARLNDACEASDRRLVVRDYNYADFVGVPLVWPCPMKSSLDAALRGIDHRSVLLTRHPVTQFLSLREHPELRRSLDYRVFLRAVRRLGEVFEAAPVFKYETLFQDFPATLALLCDTLDLPFDRDFAAKIDRVTWLTGNQIGLKSSAPAASVRSARHSQIRKKFLAEKDYLWACARYSYEE